MEGSTQVRLTTSERAIIAGLNDIGDGGAGGASDWVFWRITGCAGLPLSGATILVRYPGDDGPVLATLTTNADGLAFYYAAGGLTYNYEISKFPYSTITPSGNTFTALSGTISRTMSPAANYACFKECASPVFIPGLTITDQWDAVGVSASPHKACHESANGNTETCLLGSVVLTDDYAVFYRLTVLPSVPTIKLGIGARNCGNSPTYPKPLSINSCSGAEPSFIDGYGSTYPEWTDLEPSSWVCSPFEATYDFTGTGADDGAFPKRNIFQGGDRTVTISS